VTKTAAIKDQVPSLSLETWNIPESMPRVEDDSFLNDQNWIKSCQMLLVLSFLSPSFCLVSTITFFPFIAVLGGGTLWH
jgi:hypothetical protein